jgi:hypothetical protein
MSCFIGIGYAVLREKHKKDYLTGNNFLICAEERKIIPKTGKFGRYYKWTLYF